MSRRGPSPKQLHREGVFDLARARDGVVRCYGDRSGRTCRGRLQAAHWIGAQTLRIKQGQARVYLQANPLLIPREGVTELVETPLDDLIADPRNGVPLCSHEHHPSFDGLNGKRLELTPPQSVLEFAADYGLTHLVT